MPTVTQVNDLKINKLTKAQYEAAVQAGTIGENEISIITDLDATPQVDVLPAAAASQEGKIYQYMGTTDANYTNGYFYKCVSDGAVTPTYSWTQVNVQPSVDPLPSQSGNNGKFLTTDGTDASWSDKPLVNQATGSNSVGILSGTSSRNAIAIGQYTTVGGDAVAIGQNAIAKKGYDIAIGSHASTQNGNGRNITIGYGAQVTSAKDAIQISTGPINNQYQINARSNTMSVSNGIGNFEIMSADGTIPAARHASVSSATQGQVLALDSNLKPTWTNASGGSSPIKTTISIPPFDWQPIIGGGGYYEASVQGVTQDSLVIVSCAGGPIETEEWANCKILCTNQLTNQLTFECVTLPQNSVDINIAIFN